MKRVRYIAFFLVLLAQMVIMAHNAIPHHHHHHQKEECHVACTCHEHETKTHLCDSPNCETCTLLSDPYEYHSQSFGLTILSNYICILLPENGSPIFGTPVSIGNTMQKQSGLHGLRAPPSYL